MTFPQVKDIEITKGATISYLINEFDKSGAFMAKHLARACQLFVEMIKDEECFVFLSFTANLVATGIRGVIAKMIKEGFVDAIVTTGGAIDHDLARAFGGKYYIGEFDMDDKSLRENDIHRLGNILIPLENYGLLIEKIVRNYLLEILKEKRNLSPSTLIKEFGKFIKDENSIIYQAYNNNVPIYCPGIVDSAFETHLFFISQREKFSLDLFSDMKELLDIVYTYKKTGALIIGGGISKHHVLWWNQFKEGLDYCIYVTTAVEYDGSLSGAHPKEAISWHKLKIDAKDVIVYGDASIILPLMVFYAMENA